MNPFSRFRSSKQSSSRAVGLIGPAEHELASFFNAVKQSFGSEQAELSARDWLDELARIDGLPSSARDWRSVTVKASARLATRVNASSLSAQFTNA
jgi:hypothetical protein